MFKKYPHKLTHKVIVNPVSNKRSKEYKDSYAYTTWIVKDFDNEYVVLNLTLEDTHYEYGDGIRGLINKVLPSKLRLTFNTRRISVKLSSSIGIDKNSWKGGVLGVYHKVDNNINSYQATVNFCKEYGLVLIEHVGYNNNSLTKDMVINRLNALNPTPFYLSKLGGKIDES